MKKRLLVLVFAMCICVCINALPAQANMLKYSAVPTSGTPSSNKDQAMTTMTSRAAVGFVSYGDGLFRNGNTLTYVGETNATHIATKIGNSIIQVQVWNGYDWQAVVNGSCYQYDRPSCTFGGNYSATSGKYYRVAGSHLATIQGVNYTTGMNYSDYIYVP